MLIYILSHGALSIPTDYTNQMSPVPVTVTAAAFLHPGHTFVISATLQKAEERLLFRISQREEKKEAREKAKKLMCKMRRESEHTVKVKGAFRASMAASIFQKNVTSASEMEEYMAEFIRKAAV